MSEYGVTPTGFVKKRLDKIIKETQDYLTDAWGFDVSLNPQSALNVLITNQADRLAQLWEVAEQVYYSHYPSTAEGVSLDNAGQLAGLIREEDQRTKYLVLCIGADGTVLPKDSTIIASKTTPKVLFNLQNDGTISRLSFNKAVIKVVGVTPRETYTVTINGISYSYLAGDTDVETDVINGLTDAITGGMTTVKQDHTFTVTAQDNLLLISCDTETASNKLDLTDNLTTEIVASLILWQSCEYGKFVLPEKTITEIVTTVTGFEECYNVSIPLYGRLRETDIEFRQSYLKKIASRSSSMLESITSAILENVDEVISATAYENTEDATDVEGRPPHSIEVVVDGGKEAEIASVILNTKSAGIGTHGQISVGVPTSYGDIVTVKFNRPEPVYVWYKVVLTRNQSQLLPPNYVELVKLAINECMSSLKAGDNVITQDYIPHIKSLCTGLAYVDISIATTAREDAPKPSSYTDKNLFVTSRQKALYDAERIEVTLSGS